MLLPQGTKRITEAYWSCTKLAAEPRLAPAERARTWGTAFLLLGDEGHSVGTDHAGDDVGEDAGVLIEFGDGVGCGAIGCAGGEDVAGDGIDGLCVAIGNQDYAVAGGGIDGVVDLRGRAVLDESEVKDALCFWSHITTWAGRCRIRLLARRRAEVKRPWCAPNLPGDRRVRQSFVRGPLAWAAACLYVMDLKRRAGDRDLETRMHESRALFMRLKRSRQPRGLPHSRFPDHYLLHLACGCLGEGVEERR